MANELTPDAYGPINSKRPGNIDPFASFDNRMRYQDMVQYQMISQYQQSIITPQATSQMRDMARGEYQYGTGDDNAMRYYQRQREMSRIGRAGSMVSGFSSFGIPAAVDLAASSAGMGFMASMGAAFTVGAIPGYLITKGVDRTIERQRLMHSMALDLEQYRGNLGLNSALSYGDATALSSRILGGMGPGAGEGPLGGTGAFFNREQQSRIHKIAVSNNMLNARGYGADSGTMKQYEKNFEDLKKTTEDVVKLLQTTIEGGMSVIKNLQNSGFRNMKDIQAQVRQAKAFGGITGMGAENMMMVGAAGAQAVQGTPWSAAVGANMYQQGAAQAGLMSRGSATGQYAVDRVGGIAAAGGAIARFQMNMFSSGMGTKAVAYMMNPDGSVNNSNFNRMVSGKAGAFDIVAGAGALGYSMGPNRVLFEKKKEDFLNNPNYKGWQRDATIMNVFKAWGASKPGSMEAKAWVFAGQGTNDQRERRLISDYLLAPKGFDMMNAAGDLESMMAGYKPVKVNPYGLKAVVGGAIRFGVDWGEATGMVATNNIFAIGRGAYNAFRGSAVDRGLLATGQALGFLNPYQASLVGSGNLGDMRTGLGRTLGVEGYGDLSAGAATVFGAKGKFNLPGAKGIINLLNTKNMSADDLNTLGALASTASGNLSFSNFARNTSVRQLLGEANIKTLEKHPEQVAVGIVSQIAMDKSNAMTSYAAQSLQYNKMVKGENVDAEIARMNNAKIMHAATGKYPEGFDVNRIKYLEATKNWKKFENVADYKAYSIQAGLDEKAALSSAAKNIFWSKSAERNSPITGDAYGAKGVEKWNYDLAGKIAKSVPGFNPQDNNSMRNLVSSYSAIAKKVTSDQELSKDESALFKSLNPFAGKMLDAQKAMDNANAAAWVNYAGSRSTAIQSAGSRMGVKMSDDFKSGLTRVLTGAMSDDEAKTFASKNASTLAGIGGTSSSYYTKDLTGAEGLANRILNTPALARAAANTEKERQRTMIAAIQEYALTGRAISSDVKLSLRPDKESEFSIKDKNDAAQKLQILTEKYRMDESASVVSDDRGGSRYVNVNPPITNYWNNRWVM
jgi:hypothetical protein